ncbi:MAG: SCO family protein [Pseudomonadota bacterium]
MPSLSVAQWLLGALGAALALPAMAAEPEWRATAPSQQFTAPAPGSYTLYAIQPGPQGGVLGSDGRPYRLEQLTRGKVTLLSFMYTYCSDPIGCPLAWATLQQLRTRLLAAPNLARQVRFISLSFDPLHDTPSAMRLYAGPLAQAGSLPRWHFLTTSSVAQLKPIADDLGQDVQVQLDAAGRPSRLIHHMLKVFLLDDKGRVREIYSTAFLQPDVMYNDIVSLAMERGRAATALETADAKAGGSARR